MNAIVDLIERSLGNFKEMGGSGSGHRGHKGVKGQKGGSAPGRAKYLKALSKREFDYSFPSKIASYHMGEPVVEEVTIYNAASIDFGELGRAYQQKVVIPAAKELGLLEDYHQLQSDILTMSEHITNVPYQIPKIQESSAYDFAVAANQKMFGELMGSRELLVYRGTREGTSRPTSSGLRSYSLRKSSAQKFAGEHGGVLKDIVKTNEILLSPGFVDFGFWGFSEYEVIVE